MQRKIIDDDDDWQHSLSSANNRETVGGKNAGRSDISAWGLKKGS